MSTRCQIRIEGSPALIYRHSDGYPEGVLPDVLPFVATFFKFRGDEPDYLVARLVQHLTNESDKSMVKLHKEMKTPEKDRRPELLGFGVDTELHGDIEFLYTVKHDGSVLVEKARNGRAVSKIAEFQLGTSPDAAVAEIKRLQEAEE